MPETMDELTQIALDADSNSSASRAKNFRKIIMGAIVLVLVLIPIIYFYSQYRKTQALLKNPTAAAAQDVKETIKKVSSLIEIPLGEEPTVATVSDIEKLRDKPFFTSAKNGDKVIVFSKAQKAILYRPDTNKIVEMAPINVPQASPSPIAQALGAQTSLNTPTATPTIAPVNVAIYNGTTTTGLAVRAQKFLEESLPGYSVTETTNSVNSYDKTVVIDISGKSELQANQIASIFNATVKSLPSGESAPKTEVLVILGSDFQPE